MNHITYKPKAQPNARMILDMGLLDYRCQRKLLCMNNTMRVEWIQDKFPSLMQVKGLELDGRKCHD